MDTNNKTIDAKINISTGVLWAATKLDNATVKKTEVNRHGRTNSKTAIGLFIRGREKSPGMMVNI